MNEILKNIDIIEKIDMHTLNDLLVLIQPAHLQKLEGRQLTPEERDIKRAELLRKKLGIK